MKDRGIFMLVVAAVLILLAGGSTFFFKHAPGDAATPSSSNIAVVEKAPLPNQTIGIFGSIHRAGKYDFKPGLTLGDLIATAGGLLGVSERGKLRIARRGLDGQILESLKVDLDAVPGSRMQLEAGDVVFVPERIF